MTSNLFIVYRITNISVRKHYYGYKSCGKRDPKDILGKTYYSSSADKEFITEQKNHPERFRYKVVASFNTKEEALEREIRLHVIFDVGRNESFYNRAKQTSSNFSYRPLGDTNPMKLREHREKRKSTMMERYGNLNNSSKKNVTMMERYGVNCPMRDPTIARKQAETLRALGQREIVLKFKKIPNRIKKIVGYKLGAWQYPTQKLEETYSNAESLMKFE